LVVNIKRKLPIDPNSAGTSTVLSLRLEVFLLFCALLFFVLNPTCATASEQFPGSTYAAPIEQQRQQLKPAVDLDMTSKAQQDPSRTAACSASSEETTASSDIDQQLEDGIIQMLRSRKPGASC
jgi:hypothetical protein